MSFEDDVRKVKYALLKDAFAEVIQKNEERCKVWRAYQKGHEKVAEALDAFRKDLYVNCMVPIGKRALMKGKLIHTNEVLACLGDGYFAKYSASGAAALCQRRIQKAEEMLKNLNTERALYETKMMVVENDRFDDLAGREIIEQWNENQIIEWKKKHREREKEYHQKLAKLKQEEKKNIETEEDLFNRLDQLEIEEELADELNRLEDEQYELFGEELGEGECYYESETSSESQEEEEEEEEECFKAESEQLRSSEKKQQEEVAETSKTRKSVSFAEPEDVLKDVLKKEEQLSAKEKKEVKEKKEDKEEEEEEEEEEDEKDIIRIEFSHSENNPIEKSNSNGDSIETPADIYRIFSKPKSILKRSPNDINPVLAAPLEYISEEVEEDEEDAIKPSVYLTVVKDIKERNPTVTENAVVEKKEEIKDTRPMSKFKRDRRLKK